ncbi:MAG TPA: peptidoglycan-binding domain-containing protein [Euzebyales bacterium]
MALDANPSENFDTTASDVRLRLPLLRRNDDDENIGYTRRMKQMLIELNAQTGFTHIQLHIDRPFGAKTEEVVRRFQQIPGFHHESPLPETGTVDKATWQALLRTWLSDFSAG